MKKGVLVAIILILVVLAGLIITSTITGNVAKSGENMPRHVFYHSPRVDSNDAYTATCYPQSEVMPVLPDTKCCPGLTQLTIYDEEQSDCSAPLTGGVICSNCGNSRCEYGENECNCPQDCNKPAKRL